MVKKLTTNQPISLLDGINRHTGVIIDKSHELFGQSIADVELHFPKSSGSTVGVMTLIELKKNQKAPVKIVLKEPDTNVIMGCILAEIPIEIENRPNTHLPSNELQKISHLPPFLRNLLVKEAEILGAKGFIPITRVQIAGVSYKTIGEAGLQIIEFFANKQLKFQVPTTLNPAGMDLDAWEEQGISAAFAEKQLAIITALQQMGARLTVSCIPYELEDIQPGSHVAFGESSAVAYVNSVLNIKTNRENAIKTLVAALSGFTTYLGLHIEQNRVPDVEIHVDCGLMCRADYGALGYFAGLHSNIPYYRGIAPTTTQLKALAAAGAASGSIALFFIENIPQMKPKTISSISKSIHFTKKNLKKVYEELTTTSKTPNLLFIGCPHLNLNEIREILTLIGDKRFTIPLWISTAKAFKNQVERKLIQRLEKSNVKIYSDCCVVVSPIETLNYSVIGTDSAKAAKYLPLFSKCDVVFKPFEEFLRLYAK
ncbi:MAG: aconitase X [Candidatus Helarchaeota archaeon]